MEVLCVTGREEESWAEVIVKCLNALRKVFQVESRIFWSWENIAKLCDLKANHVGVCTCWWKNPYNIKWTLDSKGLKIRIFIEFPFLVFLGLISTVTYFFRANARKIYVGKWNRGIERKGTHLERLTFTFTRDLPYIASILLECKFYASTHVKITRQWKFTFTRKKVSYPNTISSNLYMTISLSTKARSSARNWKSQGQQENDMILDEVRIHLI